LLRDPNANLDAYYLGDATQHNNAITTNFSDLSKLKSLETLALKPEDWHASNQNNWWMPDEYNNLDVAKWILDECDGNEAELQRCGLELLEYAERNLLPLLCYLKYLVDTLRKNNIVWGVGRGSSVSSFVLYKLGVHRVNSLEYDLDFHEFMR
jgi:hypothetical protein